MSEDIGSKLIGVLGFFLILSAAYLMSNNRKAINWRLIISGLALQLVMAIFILKVPLGQQIFAGIGSVITSLLDCSDEGAKFVFGPLATHETLVRVFGEGSAFLFAFRVIPTIIFVSSLVTISYYLGIMQRLVQLVARFVAFVMGASGSEALSNAASIFVGQVEAQLLIRPYVPSMTMSELLASMAGSMACVSGGVMAVYIGLGIKASYLLTASIMAAPAALVIAKLVWPETEESQTKGTVKIEVKRENANIIDAAAHGASDGLRIGLNVCAMLIAFISIIALADVVVGKAGEGLIRMGMTGDPMGLPLAHLKLNHLFGLVAAPVAFLLGVPWSEAQTVGRLMAEKLVINEFFAYMDMSQILAGKVEGVAIGAKAQAICTFALCGLANFSSVAMQIGGIGEIAPSRREDLARLGIKALICGTMASYLSATLAGLLI